MNGKSSMTSLMSAFARAFHVRNEKHPVFNDTLATRLMTEAEYLTMEQYILGGMSFLAPEKQGSFRTDTEALRYIVNTQLAPTPIARARYTEDAMLNARRTGTEQFVLLGAGLDTFALRHTDISKNCDIFEVDHPLTQADKLERIRRAALTLPEHLRFVPVDFSTDALAPALIAGGFDPRKKTFFSWLGVSYYLSPEEIDALLHDLSILGAEGSDLVFDYADECLFSSPVRRVRNMIAMAQAGGEAMKSCFALDELEALLAKHGFLIYEHLPPAEIDHRYFAGRDETLAAFEHIHYIDAVRKNIN